MPYSNLIPVNVITGFLGSGKTTLLQRLLVSPLLTDGADRAWLEKATAPI